MGALTMLPEGQSENSALTRADRGTLKIKTVYINGGIYYGTEHFW